MPAWLLLACMLCAAEPQAPALRVCYANPQLGIVDVAVTTDGGPAVVANGLAAGSSSGWLPFAALSGSLVLRKPGEAAGDPLLTTPFRLEQPGRHTLVVLQRLEDPKLLVLPTNPPELAPGQAAIRLVNALPGINPVTLQLRRQLGRRNVDGARQTLPYGAAGEYQVFDSGPLTLLATKADEDDPFLTEPSLRLLPGLAYTAVLCGFSSAAPDELPLRIVPLVDRLP